MTQKVKLGLLISIIAFSMINNCTSIGHGSTMKSELAISSDKHNAMQRPLEVTHEIKDEIVTGKAEGSILWIPGVFDASISAFDAVGGILGGVLRGAGSAAGSIPYVGESAEAGLASAGANAGNIGPLLNNAKVLGLASEAENKLIYEKNYDGFYRTGVHAEISINIPWIIFKDYKVEVTGRPIKAKTLGTLTPERLAKIQGMTAKAQCATCADVAK